MLVSGEEAGPGVFRRAVQLITDFFYDNYGVLASPRPAQLQAALDILTEIFYRIVLRTNIN